MSTRSSAAKRKFSYFSTQLNSVTERLENLYIEIGLSEEIKNQREIKLYSEISTVLENNINLVQNEKNSLVENCQSLKNSICEMLNSVGDYNTNECSFSSGNGNNTKNSVKKIKEIEIKPPFLPLYEDLFKISNDIKSIYMKRSDSISKILTNIEFYSNLMDDYTLNSKIYSTSPDLLVDCSLNKISQLENELKIIKNEYQLRKSNLSSLLSTIKSLYDTLSCSESDYSLDFINLFLACDKDSNFDPDSSDSILNPDPDTNVDNIHINKSLLEKLNDLKNSLELKIKEKIDYKESLLNKVYYLWDKLSEDESYKENFLKSINGINDNTIEILQNELNRCNERRKDFLPVFIQDIRKDLYEIWSQLYYSEQDTKYFQEIESEDYTDLLFEKHQIELERLKALKLKWSPLLNLVNAYYDIEKQQHELELSQKDSSRLMAKGSKYDSTRLLREEQMRKRIAKKRPKITNDLKLALNAWETENEKPFKVFGTRLLDQMKKSEPTSISSTSTSTSTSTITRPNSSISTHKTTVPTIKKKSSQDNKSTHSSDSSLHPFNPIHNNNNYKQKVNLNKSPQKNKLQPQKRNISSSSSSSSVSSQSSASTVVPSNKTKPISSHPHTTNDNHNDKGIKNNIKTRPMKPPPRTNQNHKIIQNSRPPLKSSRNPTIPTNKNVRVPSDEMQIDKPSDQKSKPKKSMNWIPYEEVSEEDISYDEQYQEWRNQAIKRVANSVPDLNDDET